MAEVAKSLRDDAEKVEPSIKGELTAEGEGEGLALALAAPAPPATPRYPSWLANWAAKGRRARR